MQAVGTIAKAKERGSTEISHHRILKVTIRVLKVKAKERREPKAKGAVDIFPLHWQLAKLQQVPDNAFASLTT
jgi:hypothetical protein